MTLRMVEASEGWECQACGDANWMHYFEAPGLGTTVLLCPDCEAQRCFIAALDDVPLEEVPMEQIYIGRVLRKSDVPRLRRAYEEHARRMKQWASAGLVEGS